MESSVQGAILAAGGILMKISCGRQLVAVVHRSRYDDWCLPKGKLKEGEGFELAAIREVGEETGCLGRIKGFAGSSFYSVDGTPKIVHFYLMELEKEGPFKPSEEVDQVSWLAPKEALKRLSHDNEKAVLKASLDRCLRAFPAFFRATSCLMNIIRRLFIQYNRLQGVLAVSRKELDFMICASGGKKSYVIQCVAALLNEAERALKSNRVDEGWRYLHAANRIRVLGATKDQREALIETLRFEAEKLISWRKGAVNKLLGTVSAPISNVTVDELIQALSIRDEQYENLYDKIRLIKGQFLTLSGLFFVMIASFIIYINSNNDNAVYNPVQIVLGVIFFGLLGGAFSVAIPLKDLGTGSKIPEYITRNYVILLRIMLGAASALVLYVFIRGGMQYIFSEAINGLIKPDNKYLLFFLSFAAGFNERLVIKAVEKAEGREK